MIPNKSYPVREIVQAGWSMTSDARGVYSYDQLSAAAAIDAALTLRRIEQLMCSLGAEGLHTLIRDAAKAARRRERARLAKRRAKK